MLQLLKNSHNELNDKTLLTAEAHHQEIIDAYILSHRVRNHSESTVKYESRLLNGWFHDQQKTSKPFFAWNAMEPLCGRQMMQGYIKILVESELTSKTIRRYLGSLNQFFSFVLEHPYITVGGEYRRIQEIYGPIEKPLSEFDIPVHVEDTDSGIPMDPARIYEFLAAVRDGYLKSGCLVKERNYAMAVLAAESGLRINELIHLEIKRDLFFKSAKLQTRNAKGSNGSGKRNRIVLFTPFGQDTTTHYLNHARPTLAKNSQSDFLFVTNKGGPIGAKTAQDSLREMIACAQQVGFPVSNSLTYHWFRKIYATRFIERFPDKLNVLIELLGHSNLSSVHHYIRHSSAFIDQEIQSVLEQFGRL